MTGWPRRARISAVFDFFVFLIASPRCQPRDSLLLCETEVLFHPRLHFSQVVTVLKEAAVVVAVLTALELTFEVVVAGSAFLVAISLASMLDDFLYPPFFGFRGRIY